ncbi:outer membrane beta-barrel protein [Mucilaginibacter gilvus]|uniref:Outer membrane protein beta-barrel domain-containing protein n=1 Tax=Mucilaginibacter gilvus TaxID=2305909 RepID=A0A444MI66_9SPHI|nr:outer membrane beta-barrel protein [Mucilaginibacter gilvus]RWY47456.1 hypothetical protein EPL05_21855 [Mucilaginibacter gilvus]
MKLFCSGLILLWFYPVTLLGRFQQQFPPYNLSGTVTDKNKQPVKLVTMTLIPLQDTLRTIQTLSTADGTFELKGLKGGIYKLKASAIGFENSISEEFSLHGNLVQNMVLIARFEKLKEVVVTSRRGAIEVNNGKLVYNVEKSASASGSSAFDLLRRTPGVNVDQNDNLLLKGSSAVNVMMDGKMTYLSAQQLANMLKGMGGDNISRIEVSSTPSSQYDAAGNGGIINIITKKSNKPGYAINISSGIGAGRYLLNKHSVTGNIRTPKFNIYGNIGYDLQRNYFDRSNTNILTANGSPVTYSRHYPESYKTYYYSYKAGVDFYLTPKSTIGFGYTGFLDDWSKTNNGKTLLTNASGDLVGQVNNRIVSMEPYYNNVYNLNYSLKLDTLGKTVSADADYVNYSNNSDGFVGNQSFDPNNVALEPYQQLNYHQPNIITIRSVKTDWNLPNKKFKLKTGLKYAAINIDNDFKYDSLINNNTVYAPSLSDHFIYKEQIAATYLSASKQWKQTEIELGMRVEHTYTSANSVNAGTLIERKYTNFFPSVMISNNFGLNHKLSLSFTGRINRPNYADLNPVRFYSDKYSYYAGNPALVPEKAWITSLNYTFMDKYVVGLTYNRANNFISRSIKLDNVTGVLIAQNANFLHKERYDLLVVAPIKIRDFWELNATADVSYTKYPITQLYGSYTAKKINVDLILNQTVNLPKDFSFELLSHYTSPELYGIFVTRYYFQQDAGLKKTLLHNKLDLRLALSDIFHTNRFWGQSITNSLNYFYKSIPDSRRFYLTMTYHIGGKLDGGKSHKTEEQNRL